MRKKQQQTSARGTEVSSFCIRGADREDDCDSDDAFRHESEELERLTLPIAPWAVRLEIRCQRGRGGWAELAKGTGGRANARESTSGGREGVRALRLRVSSFRMAL
eukprot:3981387-Pleurochrysis_carterae.AAC.1